MVIWVLIMFGVSGVAGLMGFMGAASTAAICARVLCIVFLFAFMTAFVGIAGRSK